MFLADFRWDPVTCSQRKGWRFQIVDFSKLAQNINMCQVFGAWWFFRLYPNVCMILYNVWHRQATQRCCAPLCRCQQEWAKEDVHAGCCGGFLGKKDLSDFFWRRMTSIKRYIGRNTKKSTKWPYLMLVNFQMIHPNVNLSSCIWWNHSTWPVSRLVQYHNQTRVRFYKNLTWTMVPLRISSKEVALILYVIPYI